MEKPEIETKDLLNQKEFMMFLGPVTLDIPQTNGAEISEAVAPENKED